MAAWYDVDQNWYDRQEAYAEHAHVSPTEGFYPECSLEDLCAEIDRCTDTYARLADETAELTFEIGEAA